MQRVSKNRPFHRTHQKYCQLSVTAAQDSKKQTVWTTLCSSRPSGHVGMDCKHGLDILPLGLIGNLLCTVLTPYDRAQCVWFYNIYIMLISLLLITTMKHTSINITVAYYEVVLPFINRHIRIY